MSPLVARLDALAMVGGVAVEDDAGSCTFTELVGGARALAARIAARAPGASCAILAAGTAVSVGPRVALLASPGVAWVQGFLAVLMAGRVAVPLSPLYPAAELSFILQDAEADLLLVTDDLEERARALDVPVAIERIDALRAAPPAAAAPPVPAGADVALLLYTSGTTGKPKGALITHDNLAVQARLLAEAWAWGERDSLLHALPLHHLHGLGISMLTALLAGARVRMLPRFDARRVWEELGGVSGWMGVPTMYQKLFEAWDAADEATRARWSASARALRVATSGSAALPVTLAERWRALTGAIPLERFGMTEIGVGTTNPLDAGGRRAGWVGRPLPTVELRVVGDDGAELGAGASGEMFVRGPSVFPGYWRRDLANAGAFADGWFKTGDVVERDAAGCVRVLGRTSVDILKSGGYKLSALEIEEVLREHPAVAEVAVVGLPDATWGDRVVAVVVAAPGREAECAGEALRAWARERIAPYKVPREVVVQASLPRNALGKVVKPDLVRSLAAR
ncbi:MAG: AMP-binding protein [Polyangiaceae bacterium]